MASGPLSYRDFRETIRGQDFKINMNCKDKGRFCTSVNYTWDEKTFVHIKAEVNDVHENIALAVESLKTVPPT